MADTERRERARRDFFDHCTDGAARFGYICWAITAKPIVAVPGGTRSDDMVLYALTKDAALKQDAVRPLTRR